ncbi:MAG: urease accessory protein UreE [Litoreibacter sp.]|nr:urease accessory protein UreE [Litoreibacter sp.]
MNTPLPRATRILRNNPECDDTIALTYDDRLLRRKKLTSASGVSFLVDLAEVTSLNHGDAFELDSGKSVGVVAASEDLLRITGDLTRLAWHIGNRHTPCQILEDYLLIRSDHVLADMIGKLGGSVTPVSEPFRPEGGAYGHGRTFGHDHGSHDHVGHGHAQHKQASS